jgi:hypothetical protein
MSVNQVVLVERSTGEVIYAREAICREWIDAGATITIEKEGDAFVVTDGFAASPTPGGEEGYAAWHGGAGLAAPSWAITSVRMPGEVAGLVKDDALLEIEQELAEASRSLDRCARWIREADLNRAENIRKIGEVLWELTVIRQEVWQLRPDLTPANAKEDWAEAP